MEPLPLETYFARATNEGVIRLQPLEEHLCNVSKICRDFSSKIGLGHMGEILGLTHDFGKASSDFQNYLLSAAGKFSKGDSNYVNPERMRGRIDHSTAGAQALLEWASETDSAPSEITARLLSIAVVSHHSGLINVLSKAGEDDYGRRMSKDAAATGIDEALSRIDPLLIDYVRKILLEGDAAKELQEHIELLKKIGKGDGEAIVFHLGLTQRFLLSCLVDADRMDAQYFESNLRHVENATADWDRVTHLLDSHIDSLESRSKIDEVRRAIYLGCKNRGGGEKGVYTLNVPTGGGKTFSSLRFALEHIRTHSMDRIIYVIPYTSIIDQNAEAVRKIIGASEDLLLEHHSNISDRMRDSEWCATRSENWDAPIIFTTMVQFLESIYGHGASGVRRFHNLSNSVIVFDEVQSIPIKCVYPFNLLVNYLNGVCGCTAILCTATQPSLHHEMLRYPITLSSESEISDYGDALFERLKRVEIHDLASGESRGVDEIAAFAADLVSSYGNCLVISNTRRVAKDIATELRDLLPEVSVVHLSTNMCPDHRKKAIRDLRRQLESDEDVVCVSTQLIEAGVDVDFKTVIRLMAGMDSIAQAAGRCNRNGKMEGLGQVFLMRCKEEALGSLRDIREGRECTLRILREDPKNVDQLTEPKLIERFYEYYFFGRRGEMSYPIPPGRSFIELMSTNKNAAAEYRRANGAAYDGLLRQSFSDASKKFHVVEEQTVGIIVPYRDSAHLIESLLDATDPLEFKQILRRIQPFTVNLHERQFDELRRAGALTEIIAESEIYLLNSAFYDETFGLNMSGEPDTLMI